MASVTINVVDYPVYADADFADAYLAADVSRAAPWDALAADDKSRALVTATRLLQRQSWRDGVVPTTDDPVAEVVAQATSLLAIDIVAKPTLGDDGSTSSNIKSVGGSGVPTVEFFSPVRGNPLPPAAFALLRGLLGPASSMSDPALDGTAYGCSPWQRSRFDPTDYGLIGDGLGPYDPTDCA